LAESWNPFIKSKTKTSPINIYKNVMLIILNRGWSNNL
jgi:hypothetical protein